MYGVDFCELEFLDELYLQKIGVKWKETKNCMCKLVIFLPCKETPNGGMGVVKCNRQR